MAKPVPQIPAWIAGALAIALILTLVLSGCESSSTRSELEVKPLDSDLTVTFFEPYVSQSDGDFQLAVSLTTDKIYGCYNNEVHATLRNRGHDVFVEIGGIYFPDLCLTAIGPAMYRNTLHLAAGEYRLHMRSSRGDDVYALTIGRGSISVHQTDNAFTHTPDTLFWRRPDRSFAVLCGTTTETSWMCSDFLDSLQAAVAVSEFVFLDGGVRPYPESSQGHYYDAPARYFTLESGSSFGDAGEVLRRYKANVIKDQLGIGITLISWDGRRLSSWTM